MRLSVILVVVLAACSEREPPARLTASPEIAEPDDAAGYRAPAEVRREGNHLVGQPSPYLLQHAHNPVDWYPWGEEALARARELNRPIFLSIGYSTCHWCHVMEQESFEDDEVAELLNRQFVAIKVDREQRPDVDALYIEAVRRLGGSTGWPLTVMLTPDLVPFFGGTYFPRHGGGGRPGFLDVLREVRSRFDSQGSAVVAARGRAIFEQIEAASRQVSAGAEPPSPAVVDRAFARLATARDSRSGGFGSRQKFPNAPLLLAELRYFVRTGNALARDHLVNTLEQMARGGIHDVLFGSFHRYAVDPDWHVPHFEKTLYDNAQLGQLYVEAGRALEREDFVAVGRAVLDDLVERWQRPDGGLVVGFDADDPGGEGAYYTWTPAELTRALGDADGATFATMYGVTAGGDPSLEGRSVLHRVTPAALQVHLSMTPAQADAFTARVAPRLLAARAERRPPATDDKELASWNGLALIALADVGRWLDEPRYVEGAQRVAGFLLDHCWDGHRMLRGRRQGEPLGEGFLDDLALPALGLLRLHAADGDPRWLVAAHAIAAVILERYHDASLGTFLHTARADVPHGLPMRRPDLDDGVLPSGGNAATLLLLELGAMAGDRALYDAGEQAARGAAPRAVEDPFGAGFLLVALDHLVAPSREVVLAGDSAALWAVVRPTVTSRVLPIRVPTAGGSPELLAAYGALSGKVAIGGRATAYVCEIGRCELPTSDPAVLARQLAEVGVAGIP
ncbi:MAG: thioredoxin domain-containing protein [Sandaracinaceae bacterium]|nr:thioredoxin domain-containing protein [Sandaracinaceae bacterium]